MKDNFLELVNNIPGLSVVERLTLLVYLNSFINTLKEKGLMVKETKAAIEAAILVLPEYLGPKPLAVNYMFALTSLLETTASAYPEILPATDVAKNFDYGNYGNIVNALDECHGLPYSIKTKIVLSFINYMDIVKSRIKKIYGSSRQNETLYEMIEQMVVNRLKGDILYYIRFNKLDSFEKEIEKWIEAHTGLGMFEMHRDGQFNFLSIKSIDMSEEFSKLDGKQSNYWAQIITLYLSGGDKAVATFGSGATKFINGIIALHDDYSTGDGSFTMGM